MGYAYLGVHVGTGGTANGVTSGAIDTTGADFIVAVCSWYPAVTANPTFADSLAQAGWTRLTPKVSGDGNYKTAIFYKQAPTTNAAHTFSLTGTSCFPSIYVAPFSGSVASPFDLESSNTGAGIHTLAVGTITPSENNCLVIAGANNNDTATGVNSLNGGFTLLDYKNGVGSTYQGGGLGYLIQTSAASTSGLNWETTNNTTLATVIASFKAAAASAVTARRLPLLGVGA